MNSHFFTAALRDNLRLARMFVWVLVALVVFLIAMVWARVAAGSLTPLESYGQVVDIVVFRMLALAAAVASTSVVTQEVEQKTIIYLLTRPQPRAWILMSRMMAATITATVISWLALLAAGLPTLGGNLFSSPTFHKDLLILAVGALAYVSFFTLISLLINKALIVCLLYAFGWETFVQNMTGGMSRLSLSNYLTTLANHESITGKGPLAFLAGDLSADRLPEHWCWIVLIGVGVLLGAVGALWFQTNEYVAREDAE